MLLLTVLLVFFLLVSLVHVVGIFVVVCVFFLVCFLLFFWHSVTVGVYECVICCAVESCVPSVLTSVVIVSLVVIRNFIANVVDGIGHVGFSCVYYHTVVYRDIGVVSYVVGVVGVVINIGIVG